MIVSNGHFQPGKINKNVIINILSENTFSNNKYFLFFYKKLKENHKINLEKNQFETPKRYTGKSSNKTQDNETIITQERYEVLIDPDESDANGRTNDNDELSKTSRQLHHHK